MKGENAMMELKKELTAVEFMKEDLALYLNTHPMDCEAVKKYNYYVKKSKMLRQEYEKCFGMITEHDSYSPCPWQWINEPWPWEYEANFRL